ncbi:DUF2283 domain-containing protein [Enterovirga sp. CN4-39]|uniref:DUF2283 domain-containing protein n=1 Tax=Enterovirga sp. CN4-39 TaxID=3400910 RepID=UPI003C0F9F5F
MRLDYEARDGLSLHRAQGWPGAETREIGECVLTDFDAVGNVVGFDIDDASGKLDLSLVETAALPHAQAAE